MDTTCKEKYEAILLRLERQLEQAEQARNAEVYRALRIVQDGSLYGPKNHGTDMLHEAMLDYYLGKDRK